ncbi:MAG: hypothetical protein MJE68_13110, partial [Proteobacteria bacterium]|nr:hypothetical protein [Pseudomonadota bacterium]
YTLSRIKGAAKSAGDPGSYTLYHYTLSCLLAIFRQERVQGYTLSCPQLKLKAQGQQRMWGPLFPAHN